MSEIKYCPLIKEKCRQDCILAFNCKDPECETKWHCRGDLILYFLHHIVHRINEMMVEGKIPRVFEEIWGKEDE